MGKTPKPITIVVLPPCDEWLELEKLEAQGHIVVRLKAIDGGFSSNIENHEDLLSLIAEADLIIGSTAWHMDHKHRRYLTDALAQARLLKYGQSTSIGKKVKKDESSDGSDP